MSAWSWTVEKKNNYPVYSEEVFFFFHCIFSKLNLRDNVGRYLLTLILNMYHFYSSVSSCWVSHPFPFPPSMMYSLPCFIMYPGLSNSRLVQIIQMNPLESLVFYIRKTLPLLLT
uniref:Uncharacterized protein n=1 Tax=Cacopsylla melanoneura TaxID=428564 RepID=A0A8D8TQJ1_9HEMI